MGPLREIERVIRGGVAGELRLHRNGRCAEPRARAIIRLRDLSERQSVERLQERVDSSERERNRGSPNLDRDEERQSGVHSAEARAE
jgi:hypothetical protein